MSKRVLIVDDAYFMRNLLKKALKEAGYEVVGEAKNGKEGIKMYFELKPDIVTMDINMPDITGIETTKQILSKDPQAKIIAVTGNNDDAIKQEILKAGALEYLQKPFQPAFLWSKIDNMFEAKEEVEDTTDSFEVEETTAPHTEPVVQTDSVEDNFDDMEIEIMDKPDESKSQTFVIENDTDKIEFPEEYKEAVEEDKKHFELSKEKLEEDEVLVEFEDDTVIDLVEEDADLEFVIEEPKTPTPAPPKKVYQPEPIKPPARPAIEPLVENKPKPSLVTTVEANKKKKGDTVSDISPRNPSYSKNGREVNIRPPRAKLLSSDDPHYHEEVDEPILNDSEKDNYNDKNNGLLGTFKKLFKK